MWSTDDVRIVGDVVLASLIAGGARLVLVKAFIEPAAVWLGQRGYRWVDSMLGDRLPNLFDKESK